MYIVSKEAKHLEILSSLSAESLKNDTTLGRSPSSYIQNIITGYPEVLRKLELWQ